MASQYLQQLTAETAPYYTDFLPITDNATQRLRKVAVSTLLPYYNVKHYGATGDGTTDDTTAIKSAIDAAAGSLSYDSAFPPRVYFPAGRYRLNESGVFSYATSAYRKGITYFGDGMLSSVLILDVSDNATKWFYDNAANNRYNFCTFRDLWFRSTAYVDIGTASNATNRGYANGFKWTSTAGHEQNFLFERCHFTSLNELSRATGTANTDANKWIACRVWDCNNVLVLDGSQSLAHEIIGCQLQAIRKDMIVVEDGGGGEVNIFGGDHILESDAGDTTNYHLVKITATADGNFGGSNGQINFHGGRSELRSDYSRVVHWTGSGAALGKVTFRNYNFMLYDNTSETDRDMVHIEEQGWVQFENCHIPDYFGIKINSDASVASARTTAGLVAFDRCAIPVGLTDNITLDTAYGRVIAKDCIHHRQQGTLRAYSAIDFDYNWQNAGVGTRPVERKRTWMILKALTWPTSDGARDATIVLPKGATVVGLEIYKPSGGADGTSTQWHITNDGNTVTYLSTTSAAHSAEHFIRNSTDGTRGSLPLSADSLSGRILRLRGGTTTATAFGGWVLVEYY